MTHTVLYDPDGRIEVDLPLDREPHEQLVRAVLTWKGTGIDIRPHGYEQIALQLTGHARLVAADIRLRASRLPGPSTQRALAEALLRETTRRLSAPLTDSVRCCQNRARLVRALYRRLDEMAATASRCRSNCGPVG